MLIVFMCTTAYSNESSDVVAFMGWQNANTNNSKAKAIVDWQAIVHSYYSWKC